MGGGILPVAIHKGKIYFLFSREWIKSKDDGGKWSDFGGSREGDETYRETAIREGYEESGGFLGSKNNIKNLVDNHTLLNVTKNGYSCYLVLIDYDASLPKRFRNKFKKVLDSKPHMVKKHNGLYEKDMLRWYSYEDMKSKYKMFRPWFKSIVKEIMKIM